MVRQLLKLENRRRGSPKWLWLNQKKGWIPSRKLTWKWKITIFNRRYIKLLFFQPVMLVFRAVNSNETVQAVFLQMTGDAQKKTFTFIRTYFMMIFWDQLGSEKGRITSKWFSPSRREQINKCSWWKYNHGTSAKAVGIWSNYLVWIQVHQMCSSRGTSWVHFQICEKHAQKMWNAATILLV